MAINNPIADLLTRIRNANIMYHEKVSVPISKFKIKILEVIKKEGFIKDFYLDKANKKIIIYLKYNADKQRIITGLKRVSKYVPVNKIPRVYNGLGIALISTSKGVLTDYEALLQNVGGEVLAYIW
ncbi:30S ribosomal protein S8 [Candidatus Phytoplasma luffae]|uniref:Small ribosomal subunit protein uS8 n=1 Tax=Loofah witches'-broom phytoplasma TaxID=35773 RepID=A0A975FKU8_LOWBP|nr:30S ribosomal protein S8 [Candidatus Phytoplasma luffae]QTX02791.1 30S ribosomal protein S8 [Candidatus Phytoplasma luffae]